MHRNTVRYITDTSNEIFPMLCYNNQVLFLRQYKFLTGSYWNHKYFVFTINPV